MNVHNCDLMESWRMDERVPLELRQDSGQFVLHINSGTVVAVSYCPFCGKSLVDDQTPNALGAGVCDHVRGLVALPESSVRFLPREKEYVIAGSNDLQVRLFFCPTCGRELPLEQTRQCQKSPVETARLAKLFAEVASIDQAIEKAGPPDFEAGPAHEYFYWKGERRGIGYRRFVSYERLAKTVDVHVVEWADGKLEVSFLPKELPP